MTGPLIETIGALSRGVDELLPPRLPAIAAALHEGAIGPAHVEVIDKVLQQLPDSFDLQIRTALEEQVATFARDYSPRETGVLAAQLVERLDPDGPAPHASEAPERPNLRPRRRRLRPPGPRPGRRPGAQGRLGTPSGHRGTAWTGQEFTYRLWKVRPPSPLSTIRPSTAT